MRRSLRSAMAVVSVAVLVGACGGDGDSPTTTASSVSTAPATTASTTPPTTVVTGLAAVFKPVAGYAFGALDGPLLADLEAGLSSDPEFDEVMEEFQARAVTRNGDDVGIVLAIQLDATYAALPGVEDGILAGFVETAASTRTESTPAGDITVATDDTGRTFMVWVKDTLLVVVIGSDEAALLTLSTGLLAANS